MQYKIVQQHFGHKYSFQRVPKQGEQLWKFQGLGGGGGITSIPWNGNSFVRYSTFIPTFQTNQGIKKHTDCCHT